MLYLLFNLLFLFVLIYFIDKNTERLSSFSPKDYINENKNFDVSVSSYSNKISLIVQTKLKITHENIETEEKMNYQLFGPNCGELVMFVEYIFEYIFINNVEFLTN